MPQQGVAVAPRDPAEEARRLFMAAIERQNAGDHPAAQRIYLQALEIAPNLADAYNNIAVMLKHSRHLAAGVVCLRRAAGIAPNSTSILSNLGNLLWMMLEFQEAEAVFRRAIELDPNRPETLHNYGLLKFSQGDYAGAIECYQRLLAQRPDNLLVRWDCSLARLASGDLVRGFAEYDVRFDLDDPTMRFDPKLKNVRSAPVPLWQGEDLNGKTLYVYFEQGLGDTIQFARFLPMLAQRGARIVFDCQGELVRLLRGLPGVAELRPPGLPPPPADFQVPTMSLPGRLGVTIETIPAPTPYIKPPTLDVPRLNRPAGTRLAVGIAWAGRPEHANDHNRSAKLEDFLYFCDVPGVTFYSLQKGPRVADIAALNAQVAVRDLNPFIRDFADTAAIVAQLDLVICIDTAIAHLAGALGKPAFVLLPYTPDWRWLGQREDTPWYPSLRLVRQPKPQDWRSVMQKVRNTLVHILSRPSATP
jgi:tetratricopeptide (TPR) repeat protein